MTNDIKQDAEIESSIVMAYTLCSRLAKALSMQEAVLDLARIKQPPKNASAREKDYYASNLSMIQKVQNITVTSNILLRSLLAEHGTATSTTYVADPDGEGAVDIDTIGKWN